MSASRRPRLRPRSHLPSGYSHRYERETTLDDGRVVFLRPVVPDDVDELRNAVAEADAETLHNRFLGGSPPSTENEFQQLVRVDYDRRFAVVALSQSRRGVGIARYEAKQGSTRAEVAVAVDPGWRRVGLATALLGLLGEAAIDNGIDTFTVVFVVDNVDVNSILRETHLPVVLHRTDGLIDAEVDIGAAEKELGLQLPPSRR
jgi:GNAT superfamily N-acetyltransferase